MHPVSDRKFRFAGRPAFPFSVAVAFIGCLLAFSAVARAATYWVAPPPLGSDDHPGTRTQPWATPYKAVAAVAAGDTVYFRDGVYALSKPVTPTVAGTAAAWITLAGYPGERPVFDGAGFIPANHRETSLGLFQIERASYLRLRNLHVRNSHGLGFMVCRPAGHVEIVECSSHETFAPGIGLWNCEHVKVLHCEVTAANTNRQRLYGDARFEAPHEAISSGGAKDFEIAYNHVHHCDKEGIDIKEVSAHGVVHHNYVHDMPRQGLYADAWFGTLQDVEFHHNVVHDCEWGIGISTEDRGSVLQDVRVHHNLFYQNRGSGIYFSRWGVDGPRRHVVFAFNTLYANGTPGQFSGPVGSIDLRSASLEDIAIFNNVCAAGGFFEIASFADPARGGLQQLAAKKIRISHNLIGPFHEIDPQAQAKVLEGSEQLRDYGRSHAIPGDQPITGAAGFMNAAADVFYLAENSAARGAGLRDPAFPSDAAGAPDLGAFPFGADRVPDPAPVIEHVFENVWRVVQPTVPGRNYRRQESSDGVNWQDAAQDAIGNYIPDIHYFRSDDGAKPAQRYRITSRGAVIDPRAASEKPAAAN